MSTTVLSRKKLGHLKDIVNHNSAIIVFYEENGPIRFNNEYKDIPVIQVKIADQRYIEDTYDNEFKLIAKFILNNINKDFICICTYGISRSSACAMAIDEYIHHNGIHYFMDERYEPNKEIFNKIYFYLMKGRK